MNNFYLPLLMVIGGNLVYHLSQKLLPREANPLHTMILVYAVAILACAACALFVAPGEKTFLQSARAANLTILVLGLSVAMIEVGFLFVYRVGWNISTASITASVALTLMLIPVGLLAFKEHLSARNLVGLLFCLIGLVLVAKK
jgi:drug/metabolite transporter (DMT)-like permease